MAKYQIERDGDEFRLSDKPTKKVVFEGNNKRKAETKIRKANARMAKLAKQQVATEEAFQETIAVFIPDPAYKEYVDHLGEVRQVMDRRNRVLAERDIEMIFEEEE
jgi:hypothetical protein